MKLGYLEVSVGELAEAASAGVDLRSLLSAAGFQGAPGTGNNQVIPPPDTEGRPTGTSEVELCRQVLTRIPVPKSQDELFKALREVPEGLSPTELAIRLGKTADQLAGVMGGFGRRINTTPGVPKGKDGGTGLFLTSADDVYSLKPHAVEALKATGWV